MTVRFSLKEHFDDYFKVIQLNLHVANTSAVFGLIDAQNISINQTRRGMLIFSIGIKSLVMCLFLFQDELSAKAELTEEEKTQAKKSKKSEAEKQDKQMSPKHTGDATGAAAAGDEPDKDKAKNTVVKREKEMKMGEDGHMEVPKSEQRPRSNSGTRFLTDKVRPVKGLG